MSPSITLCSFVFHLYPSAPNSVTSCPSCSFRAGAREHVHVAVFLCAVCACVTRWGQGVLVEEVASHNSQLMSITLIRSSIHGRAQGPIHHTRTPRASGTFALSHRLIEVNCHSLKTSYTDASMGAQMHARKHASDSSTRAY